MLTDAEAVMRKLGKKVEVEQPSYAEAVVGLGDYAGAEATDVEATLIDAPTPVLRPSLVQDLDAARNASVRNPIEDPVPDVP